MFIPFGIVLLVAGAILTFAVDRRVDGVDVQLVGWILMAGGGLSLIVAMIRGAGAASVSRSELPGGGPEKHPAGDPADDVAHQRSLHRADDPAHRSAHHLQHRSREHRPEHRPDDQLADDEKRRAA